MSDETSSYFISHSIKIHFYLSKLITGRGAAKATFYLQGLQDNLVPFIQYKQTLSHRSIQESKAQSQEPFKNPSLRIAG